MQEKNFIPWLQKCISTLAYADRNTTLGRLAQIVDTNEITPTFTGDKSIKFSSLNTFFSGYKVSNLRKIYNSKENKYKVTREDITSWSSFKFDKLYIQIGNSNYHKNVYLNSINDGSSITIIQPVDLAVDTKLTKKQQDNYLAKQATILKLFKQGNTLIYDDVVIPEDWKKKLEAADKEEAEIILTPAEQRKRNAAIVVKEASKSYGFTNDISFSLKDIKISTITNFDLQDDITNVIYGFSKDRKLLEFISSYMLNNSNKNTYTVFSISKENEKYFRDVKKAVYIETAFKDIDLKNKTINVNEIIRKYNTIRLMQKSIRDLNFLTGYSSIDLEVFDKYIEISNYIKSNYISDLRDSAETEINEYLDKVTEFQLFVRKVKGNVKLVGSKSMELFGTKDFEDALVLDVEIYEKYKNLLSYAAPIKTLLNEIPALTYNHDISQEIETEIKSYINFKLNLD